jgi:hypothetical protein
MERCLRIIRDYLTPPELAVESSQSMPFERIQSAE